MLEHTKSDVFSPAPRSQWAAQDKAVGPHERDLQNLAHECLISTTPLSLGVRYSPVIFMASLSLIVL